MSPTYGGWGGRYVWRQFYGETRPIWTQGGDSFPGRDNSRDTVIGVDGKTYTSDQATIWRWRTAFQHDFAARMDWTIKDVAHANHNPDVVVNGQAGKAPDLRSTRRSVRPPTLDAARHPRSGRQRADLPLVLLSGSRHRHSRPAGRRRPAACRSAAAARRGEGGIPSAPGAGRASRAAGNPSEREYRTRDGHAACARHDAHHPGGRGQRTADADLPIVA